MSYVCVGLSIIEHSVGVKVMGLQCDPGLAGGQVNYLCTVFFGDWRFSSLFGLSTLSRLRSST